MSPRINNRSRGLSLVELMVALAVSGLLLLGLVQVFIGNKQNYVLQESLSHVQENGRYALFHLGQELQTAGYLGCSASLDNVLDAGHASYSAALFDFSAAVSGWEYLGSGIADVVNLAVLPAPAANHWDDDGGNDLTPSLLVDAVAGSDVLVVKRAEEALPLALATPMVTGNSGVDLVGAVPAVAQAQTDEFYVLGNCSRAVLFQNCDAGAEDLDLSGCLSGAGRIGPGNAAATWPEAYSVDGTLHPVRATAFYVRRNPAGVPALYRKRFHDASGDPAEELVEGVENMQVLYGVDTDSDSVPNAYVTADQVNGNPVVAVEVALMLRALVPADAQNTVEQHQLTLTDVQTPADRWFRKSMAATVKLRNRGRFDG